MWADDELKKNSVHALSVVKNAPGILNCKRYLLRKKKQYAS